ncbi:MAG: glycosyltransferase [Kiritimatiellae bacterium]|nr:glycosyltransferase [Kiritimatiellia bacterium]
MRILHITNFISPHQMPLARQLAAAVGDSNFRLAVTQPMTVEMQKRGWRKNEAASWILCAGENANHRLQFEHWWDEADVVISGYLNVPRLADRVGRKKLTFYMSERWWKPPLGRARLLYPRFAWMAARFCRLAQLPWFHFLPIGRYAATDMRRLASFYGRTWNWGYFTTVPAPLPACRERNGALRILWAGRMLPWKRVDTLIRAFALLLQNNVQARLTLIGDGPCLKELERLAQKLEVAGNIDFHSSMTTVHVRNQMRSAHVYVLPSNGGEGWGAVLNEAMSEGCAVVASEDAGSSRIILRHGRNGLLFVPGDYRKLGNLLVQLSTDESLRRRLTLAGQRTIAEEWSPQVAADRFLAVSKALLAKHSAPSFKTGPMAPA